MYFVVGKWKSILEPECVQSVPFDLVAFVVFHSYMNSFVQVVTWYIYKLFGLTLPMFQGNKAAKCWRWS